MDVDEPDLVWCEYFQEALNSRLDYINPFCKYSENGIDCEITKQERHLYVTFLLKFPEIYTKLKVWPNTKQMAFILAIAGYISKNEASFKDIQTTFELLIEMVEKSINVEVKLRYLEMFCSFLNHTSGQKYLSETNYLSTIYPTIIQCQQTEQVYDILVKILENASKFAPKVAEFVVKQMARPIVELSNRKRQILHVDDCKRVSSDTLTCLVETLERLLSHHLSDVLSYFQKLKLKDACYSLAAIAGDCSFSILVNRIFIIMSFYEMTDFFDGIKVVNHDPIALSGFLRIIEEELKKKNLETIFELYYYFQKYWKNIAEQMPQYYVKDRPINVEDQIMSFQIEPLVIVGEKLLGVPQTRQEEVRSCYLADILNIMSTLGLALGYEIREQLNKESLQINIIALKGLIKSKVMYSRKNLAIVFQTLTYCLRDFVKYLKYNNQTVAYDREFAESMFDAILVYLENFDLSWRESIGSIELTNLVYDFLFHSARWSSVEVDVKALKTLNVTIYKHMSPTMALLLDTSSCLHELDSLLLKKCQNEAPEVRQAALTIVQTILQQINQGFKSFKKILQGSFSEDLFLAMSLSDPEPNVRIATLKCLQEVILSSENNFGQHLIDKILQILLAEQHPMVASEVICLIDKIYQSENNLESNNYRIYNAMASVQIKDGFVEAVMKFWGLVIQSQLEKQGLKNSLTNKLIECIEIGMVDGAFPTHIFSKECKKIVKLDDKEIRKRILLALDNMSRTGCFSVLLQRLLEMKNVPVSEITVVSELLKLLQKYEVTAEFVLLHQTYPNLWSISSSMSSPIPMNEDGHMREIIEETVMEMINNSTSDFTSMLSPTSQDKFIGESCSISQVSTVDFIDFLYRRFSNR